MSGKVALERQAVYIRHVRRRQSGETGGVEVGGDWYVAQPLKGLNGEQGWQSGTYEPHEGEEGTFALTFPNDVGGDGVLHKRRFLVFTKGEDFRDGDEFIEVYEGDAPVGRPLWVGVVTAGSKKSSVEVRGTCAMPLLKHARETRAGFWTGQGPRDVWEQYTQVWRALVAEDFAGQEFAYDDSSTLHTTADGAWQYMRAESVAVGSVCRLRAGTGETALLQGQVPFSTAAGRWRAEATLARSEMEPPPGDEMEFSLFRDSDDRGVVRFYLVEGKLTAMVVPDGVTTFSEEITLDTAIGVPISLALEGDRRWVYFYVDGALKATLPTFEPSEITPLINLLVLGGSEVTVTVDTISCRVHEPLLLRGADKGDYRIPGSLPVGGLVGSYYLDNDLAAKHGADTFSYVLNPTRAPSIRRQDEVIDYVAATSHQSVRWVGAIYLDLAAYNARVRIAADDRARVWIGKTRFGEQVIDDWTSAGHGAPVTTTSDWLRDTLGELSGWYPIVIEAANDTGGIHAEFQAERSDLPGSWVYPAGVANDLFELSPLGCFAQQVQGDSHYDMLIGLRDSFGYQFTCEPRVLETGEFPGQLIPRLRLGRDTDLVLDDLGAVEPVADVNAENTVDELIVDGSGLSDPAQGAQQTQVAENFGALSSGRFMIHSEQESLADISDLALLRQRAQSLLALRSGPWEEVQAQPEDKSRKPTDTFPLTGELAEFDWEVGHGLRLAFEVIDVIDELPRQIKAVPWPIRPDGRGAPGAVFRQRPRNFVEILKRLIHLAQAPQRNYQGQLVTVPGSVGAKPTTAALPDSYSRVNLPANLDQVVRAELVVQSKSDASAMTIEINGIDRGSFTAARRYDVSAYVAALAAGEPLMRARVTGGTGTAEYALELLVAT